MEEACKFDISESTLNASNAEIIQHQQIEAMLIPMFIEFRERATSELNRILGNMQNELAEVFSQRKLFVLFEKELNCDPKTDHLMSKNVYPLYEEEFELLISRSKSEISNVIKKNVSLLVPRVYGRINSELGDSIETLFELSRSLSVCSNETVGLNDLLDYSEALSVEEKMKLRKEIQYLKEQIVTKHRIETLYTSDAEADKALRSRFNNVTRVAQNELLDEIVSLSEINERYEKACNNYQAEIKDINNQNTDLKGQIAKLNDRLSESEEIANVLTEQLTEKTLELSQLQQEHEEALCKLRNIEKEKMEEHLLGGIDSNKEVDEELIKQMAGSIAECTEEETAREPGEEREQHNLELSEVGTRDYQTPVFYTELFELSNDEQSTNASILEMVKNESLKRQLMANGPDQLVYSMVEVINKLDELNQFQQYMGVALGGDGKQPDDRHWTTRISGPATQELMPEPTDVSIEESGQQLAVSLINHHVQKIELFAAQQAVQQLQCRNECVQVPDEQPNSPRAEVVGVAGDLLQKLAEANPEIDVSQWHVNKRTNQLSDLYGCTIDAAGVIRNQWHEIVADYALFKRKRSEAAMRQQLPAAEEKAAAVLQQFNISRPESNTLGGLFAHIARSARERTEQTERWRDYERSRLLKYLDCIEGLDSKRRYKSLVMSYGEQDGENTVIGQFCCKYQKMAANLPISQAKAENERELARANDDFLDCGQSGSDTQRSFAPRRPGSQRPRSQAPRPQRPKSCSCAQRPEPPQDDSEVLVVRCRNQGECQSQEKVLTFAFQQGAPPGTRFPGRKLP